MKKYRWLTGIKKGAMAAAAIGAGLAAGAEVIAPLGATGQITTIAVVTAAAAAIRVATNWWKVHNTPTDTQIVR
jgi:hypothetical protein